MMSWTSKEPFKLIFGRWPMASYGAMADAHKGLGADSHTVIVADKLAEPKQLILTANQDTVYMSGVLDLREGPMVMELPPGLLGTLNNIWQQPLVDLGGPFSPEAKPRRKIPHIAAGLPRPSSGNTLSHSALRYEHCGLLPQGNPKNTRGYSPNW